MIVKEVTVTLIGRGRMLCTRTYNHNPNTLMELYILLVNPHFSSINPPATCGWGVRISLVPMAGNQDTACTVGANSMVSQSWNSGMRTESDIIHVLLIDIIYLS